MLTREALSAAGTEAGLEFGEFFDAEFRRLAKAMFLLTGDLVEAEDLSQEALARAFERWDRIRQMASPQGYVYRIAFNLNRRRFRRQREAPEPVATVDPEQIAEDRMELRAVLATMTREQREALILVEWVGLGTDEAGRVLGIDATSVRTRLHRARAAVRERFGGEDA